MPDQLFCSNCGKPIQGVGVMMPTIDKTKRNQCLECGNKDMASPIKIKKDERVEWERKLETNLFYIDVPFKYWSGLIDFIRSLLTQSRKEAVKEILEKWRQAIYYSEDTKSCLDRKIMLNHFNEAKLKTNTK